ncbi:MAG: DNA repair and recombination protein RadB [Candidatus Altiarchaeota archaeon]|nr:DNA repair and recombination protein RadB [Candidatus Altiarchaeota archaeon]
MISVERDFDVLLGGGLQPKTITHIYGVPASGKTNFALMATTAALGKGKVIYMDCEGGFSTERLKQICGKKLKDVLSNVLLFEPTDFDEQKLAIKKLSDIVSGSDVSLIIVDSISVLYRLQEEKDTRELGRLIAQLLRIARRHDIPVLITNQVYTDIDSGRIVPVGGDLTRYWSKIILEFIKEEGTDLRTVILRKHKFLPEGMKLRFRINNSGIESLGVQYPTNVVVLKGGD